MRGDYMGNIKRKVFFCCRFLLRKTRLKNGLKLIYRIFERSECNVE